MARNSEDTTFILNSKSALPNKLLQNDGTVTDLIGNQVINPVDSYKTKPALPNKFLNPDGTYSTLNEIIAGSVDTSLFIIVEELPASGNEQKIYLVPDDKGGFVEYHWTGDKWDPIGTVEIDLSNYSTTQEMINAIEAAALTTLNSAKSYTDEQIARISSDHKVFCWDGTYDQAGITFWNNIVQANQDTPVIVYYKQSSSATSFTGIAFFNKNTFTSSMRLYTFSFTPYSLSATIPGNFYSQHREWRDVVNIYMKDGAVTSVTLTTYNDTIGYLDVDTNYSSPYNPKYPGSPATKKYVDDAIAANITDMLGGSY